MPFQPGQSGNPGGRVKEKPFREALLIALKEAGDDRRSVRSVATQLVDEAMKGNVPAIKEIADRLDGKVPQGIIGGEETDPPIRILQTLLEAIDGRSKSIPAAEPTSE